MSDYFHRKSIRLKEYDYSEPGSYFVTICTRDRECLFGDIVDGAMRLSDSGRIADTCWRAIPAHFPNTNVDVFQIMPNHVHGIVEIGERCVRRDADQGTATRNGIPDPDAPNAPHAPNVRVEYIQPLHNHINPPPPTHNRFQHVIPRSLGSIIRSFKGAVTREINNNGNKKHRSVWQRNFYDHIIRDDISYYYIERYINLNTILWHTDSDNPGIHETPIEVLRRNLKDRHNLDEDALSYVVECEMEYRDWQRLKV